MFKNWSKTWRDFSLVVVFLVVTILVGLILVWTQRIGDAFTATLWSLACLAFGSLIGFLFGIPRVLQQNPAPAPTSTQGNAAPDINAPPNNLSNYRMEPNTNLEQISDWLTKIIVGIGLVELRRIPEIMNRLSLFVAGGLGASPQSQVLVMALIIYFAVLGFLGGYLMTRIYLAQAFSRADWELQNNIGAMRRKPLDEQNLLEKIEAALKHTSAQVKSALTETVSGDPNLETRDQISEILDKAVGQAVERIRETGFLTLDSRPLLKDKGKIWQVPYDQYGSVSALLDDIWDSIGTLPAFTYATKWLLRDAASGKIFKDLGSKWARDRGRNFDDRRLEDIGIKPGMELQIISPKDVGTTELE
jgi:hypothetical protein